MRREGRWDEKENLTDQNDDECDANDATKTKKISQEEQGVIIDEFFPIKKFCFFVKKIFSLLASDEFRCETDRFQKKYNGSNSIETTNAHDEEGEREPGEDRKRIPEIMNHKKNKTQHPTRKSGNEMTSKGSNAKGNGVIGGEVPLGERRVEIHPAD